MAKKKKKPDISKKYNFDIQTGQFVEKKSYVESKNNPMAIVYVRVSDQKQVDQGSGLDSQESNCRRWAENQGISVVKVFSDGGISGAYLDRKGLSDAIAYLKQENHKNHKISYFLCTEFSRISRSEETSQTMDIKKAIEATGVSIITTYNGRNISSENVNDSLITDIDIALAKNERLRIRERSMSGTLSKLYAGFWTFDPPVGYERTYVKNGTKTEKFLQKVEPQASIVKEGLEMFANGVFQNNTQLLQYFNEKMLKSNHHDAKPGKLNLMFVQRLFIIEKLYFYAGFILYPNYGIIKPIEAIHQPLITLSTAHKILKRVDAKGKLKFGPRKDSNDLYPLRGLVCCVHCDYPMTARPSTGGMGKIYHYYGCNRKECKDKENISIEMMHNDFKELLQTVTPKKGILKMLDLALKEIFKEKNKIIQSMVESKKRRIKEIEKEVEGFPGAISKLTKIEVIQRLEEKWSELETEKELLEEEIKDKTLNEEDFERLYARVRNIIEDPLSIWDMGTLEMKIGLVKVLFGEKIYYTKKGKYQTPHLSALYCILDHLNDGKITSGAGDETRTRNQQLGRLGL